MQLYEFSGFSGIREPLKNHKRTTNGLLKNHSNIGGNAMPTIRNHKNKNFTVMSNTHLRDKKLSLKAKGLLSLMFSLPDDWIYSIRGLCSICKENETAIKSALNELKANGYVKVNKLLPDKTNNGRIKYEYEVFEEPQAVSICGIKNKV